jgi:hypothetical protein
MLTVFFKRNGMLYGISFKVLIIRGEESLDGTKFKWSTLNDAYLEGSCTDSSFYSDRYLNVSHKKQ